MGCCTSCCFTNKDEENPTPEVIVQGGNIKASAHASSNDQIENIVKRVSLVRRSYRSRRGIRPNKSEQEDARGDGKLIRVYGWGDNSHGELGFGLSTSGEFAKVPTIVEFEGSGRIQSIACGDSHTIFLLRDGTVWTCGSNDHGQLGHSERSGKPELVEGLENYEIVAVCAGYAHSLALERNGLVFSWGSDSHGQLGLKEDDNIPIVSRPTMISSLSGKVVVQIAAGHSHSLVLTDFGEVFTFGSNRNGQLGYETENKPDQRVPRKIELLSGYPIALIVAGEFHSFVVSVSGGVFGWGKNNHGQLGIGDTDDRNKPVNLKSLTTQNIRYVSAGSDHTAFLTQEGGVFTCGAWSSGQLGHPSKSDELRPRKILEFGSAIIQISCGRGYTLCTTAAGKVYSFGRNEEIESSSPNHIGQLDGPAHTIFSGNGQNFALLCQDGIPSLDFREYAEPTQIIRFTAHSITNICFRLETIDPSDIGLVDTLMALTASASAFNASFLVDRDYASPDATLMLGDIDLEQAELALSKLDSIKSAIARELIDRLLPELLVSKFSSLHQLGDHESLRVFVLITLFPTFHNRTNFTLPLQSALETLTLPKPARKMVFSWLYNSPIEQLQRLVSVYKKAVLSILGSVANPHTRAEEIKLCLVFLQKLNSMNRKRANQQRLSYHAFTIPQLSTKIDIPADYVEWIVWQATPDPPPSRIFFSAFPFVYDSHAKSILLEADQKIQMKIAMDKSVQADILTSILTGTEARGPMSSLFLNIRVTRENIVADTISELVSLKDDELNRPLRVKFIGEEGEDAGGVQKEFFLLLTRDLLSPNFGMFRAFEDSNLIWFNESHLENQVMFYLVGVLLSIAIYNSTILSLPFPLALYKKLLGQKVGFEDFKELEPILAFSLEQLLEYTESDFEGFDLKFDYTLDVYGKVETVPLKKNGSDISVTIDNVQEYVDLLVDYKLNKSIDAQFSAFKDGFVKVCGTRILSLFHPEQLQEMVVGNQDYDWGELERNCNYQVYNSNDSTVLLFWEVFHELSLDDKKQFLLFLTGSDRIPILGMKGLNMIIQRAGSENHLPVAHTCFNILDLPPYKTKEIMQLKLGRAIQNNVGFTLA